MTDIERVLKRGVAEIIVEEEFRRLLEAGKPLRLKMGFDPSRPDLTLGHVVGLRKLRQFQELGHRVILIVGDWTAQIGDPSGQSVTRPMLTAEEVRANAETYMRQFFRVVDRERTEVRWQSAWFGGFTLADVIRLTSRFTVAQMLQRDDFAARYREGRPIAITEFLYPLLQAYDSVAIRSDVEFGGTDQTFNLLVGRQLQEMMGQRPQQILTVPLLVGSDGRKMSKSLGNYIAVEDPPNDMYGKVMSIPDAIMMDYFELLTDVPDEELAEMRRKMVEAAVNPMEYKLRLAKEITAQFHDEEKANEAAEHFNRVVRERETPEDIPVVYFASADTPHLAVGLPRLRLWSKDLGIDATLALLSNDLVEPDQLLLALGLVKSRNEARRLLAQNAVEVHSIDSGVRATQVVPPLIPFRFPRENWIIQVGKRRFVKLVHSAKQP